MVVRRRRGGPREREPAHRPRALVRRWRGRPGGGVHRLVLDVARRAGFVAEEYVDEAEGVLEKRADGKMAMTRVTLRPRITWGTETPDEAAIADLHHRAHESCFIANSVTTEVKVEH